MFVLPDPRRYGPVSNDGPASSIQLTNRGNFPATPVLTVAGSRPGGYTIVGPAGQQFVVGQALTAGHPHVIDMEDGTLSIDGAVVPGAVTAPRLFTIPAATSGTVSLAGAPAGVTISGQLPDTFI